MNRTMWMAAALAVAWMITAGCPPPKPPEPSSTPTPKGPAEVDEKPKMPRGKEVKKLELPQSMVIGKNVTLSGFYEDEELPEEGAAHPAGEGAAQETSTRGTVTPQGREQNVYKLVAPATVIVTSQRGYGSGVIYHPDGWILTNHHVIAHAQREDFRMKVKIGLGELSDKGVIQKQEKLLDAYVHKMDPMLDIAVVKLVDPPKGLQTVTISATDPSPGERVWSLGHAGIGLMWAIKDGQIAAIGKLSTHLAQLLLLEAGKDSKSLPGNFMARIKAKQLEAFRRELMKKKPALVIQSTCDISQGDSGGPLVNNKSELVGLNSFIRQARGTRKESNFHVHVSEVRKFIQEVPQEAPQMVPDPWTEGGSLAKLGDADMDGKIDVLAMYKLIRRGFFKSQRPLVYFFDLNQDSFTKDKAIPKVSEVVDKRAFDAELIYMETADRIYAWYDTDGDGAQDVLLGADKYKKVVLEGYRIDPQGKLTKDDALKAGKLVRPAIFTDEALRARLLAVGQRLFDARLVPSAGKVKRGPPDPIKGAGHEGTLQDYSRDGKPDTISARGMFSNGSVVDLDQDSLGSFKVGASMQELARSAKPVDAEFSLITQPRGRFAWYDTNNDGAFDLVLKADQQPLDTVDSAFTVSKLGALTAAPGYQGRKLVQPELLKDQAEKLRKVVRRFTSSASIAAGAGIKTFPDPNEYYTWGFRMLPVKKWKDAAVTVRKYRYNGVLVDVDRDMPRRCRKAGKPVSDMVRAKKFDAEFVQIRNMNKVWAFYDTRGKGRFDLVLFSATGGKGKPSAAYVVDAKGRVSLRAKPLKGEGMAQPKLFVSARLRRNFKKMVPELKSALESGSTSYRRPYRGRGVLGILRGGRR